MNARALEILKTVYGYDAFRGPQARIVEHVIAGNNAFVLMPTGGGKSLCYQIPAIARPGMGLVVSPLPALMADQVAALRQAGVRAAALNSDLPPDEQRAVARLSLSIDGHVESKFYVDPRNDKLDLKTVELRPSNSPKRQPNAAPDARICQPKASLV